MFNSIDFNEFKNVDIYDNTKNYIGGVGFTRSGDKGKFILGVLMIIAMAYVLGRYPHTYYYDFHCVISLFLIF